MSGREWIFHDKDAAVAVSLWTGSSENELELHLGGVLFDRETYRQRNGVERMRAMDRLAGTIDAVIRELGAARDAIERWEREGR